MPHHAPGLAQEGLMGGLLVLLPSVGILTQVATALLLILAGILPHEHDRSIIVYQIRYIPPGLGIGGAALAGGGLRKDGHGVARLVA